MPIEHLLWGRGRVGHGPVIDSSFRHDSDRAVRYPLPEGDVLSISVRLDLRLGLDVEYLQCPTGCTRNAISLPGLRSHTQVKRQRVLRTFKGQNLLVRVHNRGVGGDWSTQNIIGVVQVDNNHLVLFVDFLPHTDEMVGFEGQCLSSAGVNQRL